MKDSKKILPARVPGRDLVAVYIGQSRLLIEARNLVYKFMFIRSLLSYISGDQSMKRSLAVIIVVLIIILALLSFFSSRAPRVGTKSETGTKTTSSNIESLTPIEIELPNSSSFIDYSFIDDTFIYLYKVASHDKTTETIYLNLINLKSMNTTLSIPLERYGLASNEQPCVKENDKTSIPNYHILWYDKTNVYVERECLNPGKIIIIDTINKVILDTNVSSDNTIAFGDNIAYKLFQDRIEAINLTSGEINWSHNFTPSYVFPGESRRHYIMETPIAVRTDKTEVTAVFVDGEFINGMFFYVLGVLEASQSGISDYYEIVFNETAQSLHYQVRAALMGEQIYVVLGFRWWDGKGWNSKVLLYKIVEGEKPVLVGSWNDTLHEQLSLGIAARDGYVIVWRLLEKKLITVTRGDKQWTMESPITAISVLTSDGDLVMEHKVASTNAVPLAFIHYSLYYVDGRYVYTIKPGSNPTLILDLGPRSGGGLGTVIVLPIVLPIIPFMEKPPFSVYYYDGFLYVYNGAINKLLSYNLETRSTNSG